ncbi:MAG: uracil-DNA glycosylase family 4 [Candidatus Nanohaloarchaea archaeon]|jgi:uracil-DNA glycosylase family 4
MDFQQKYREFFDEKDGSFYDGDRFVTAVGPEDADVMMVGEAPGENEVKEGEPFVGRAGQKLNDILKDIGVERSDIYITNLVKVRPPENRDPKREEIDYWRPLLDREIEEVDPDIVLTLGNFASKELLGKKEGITSIHGRIFSREGRKIMPVYHPAATLYDRSKTPELEKDLRKAFGKEETGQTSLKDL